MISVSAMSVWMRLIERATGEQLPPAAKAAGTAPGGGRSDAVDPSLTPASIGSGLVDGPIVDVPVDQYARFSTLLCIATSPND